MKEQTIEQRQGKLLREMRQKKMKGKPKGVKLTQKRLAGILGISRETVSAIECGHKTQVDCMPLSTMAEWVKACGGVKGIDALKKELGALVVSKINGNS